MSAIAGIYHLQQAAIDPDWGPLMMSQLERYPVDRAHIWQQHDIFLGNHAQWITPESVNEVLPYYDITRGLAITADAIIDNRPELFEQLGVPRADQLVIPDSLLILLAYEKWGKDTPAHLIGDFAFMIWDEKKHSLFGARDFSGSRTLYFSRSGGLFAFCSVIHPLFSLPGNPKILNEQWTAQYLTIPLLIDVVDSFSTPYNGIEQIPPSYSITVEHGNVSFSRYCNLNPTNKLRLKSNHEYEEALQEVLGRAVNDSMRTHRTVGSHLSGGIDSGSIASLAARNLVQKNQRLHTFSSYPIDGFVDYNLPRRFADERPYIQSTIDYVGNIEPHFYNFPDMTPYTEIDSFLDIMEMPYKFFENSFWIKGLYQEAQKQDIGILLSGKRGNATISWGPALDYQALLIKQFRWIRFFWEHRRYCQNMGADPKAVLKIVGKKVSPLLARLDSNKEDLALPQLVNASFAEKSGVHEVLKTHGLDLDENFQSIYTFRKTQFDQLFHWNATSTLSSKFSLNYKLWDRDPTNDLRVVRFCLSLPENQYVQNGVDRSLIRRAMKDHLPDNIRLNRKSRGIQGADVIERMLPLWKELLQEFNVMIKDHHIAPYINQAGLAGCLQRIGNEPYPELIKNYNFRLLMRGLIFYRFMKKIV